MTEMHLGDVKKARDMMWTILNIKCFLLVAAISVISYRPDILFNTVSFGTMSAILDLEY